MNDPFDRDPYEEPYFRELSNDGQTFTDIAARLSQTATVAFRWRDGHGSAMTICMSIPPRLNYVPGLDPLGRALFVGVERYGLHPFDVSHEDSHSGYIAEKLLSGRMSPTADALAELINGVKAALSSQS